MGRQIGDARVNECGLVVMTDGAITERLDGDDRQLFARALSFAEGRHATPGAYASRAVAEAQRWQAEHGPVRSRWRLGAGR